MTAAIGELLANPLWLAEDLGRPIPPSTHAVSVALPTWRDNVGYEEGDPRVVDALQAGYPRFVYHPLCQRLFDECLRRGGQPDEKVLAFSTAASARRCADWLRHRVDIEGRVVDLATLDFATSGTTGGTTRELRFRVRSSGFSRSNGSNAPEDFSTEAASEHAVFFPKAAAAEAKAFWQHSGEGVSSRRAAALLGEREVDSSDADAPTTGLDAKQILRERVAGLVGVSPENVFLFPCGMNAAFQLHRVLIEQFPGRRTAQFGFPYVDTLKIQEKLGPGAVFLRRGDTDDLARLTALAESEPLAGVYTEFPSNPLLLSPDLAALRDMTSRRGVPLIVDDTVASCINVDVLPMADALWMSLTKYFSGAGDVTGGAVVLNSNSVHYDSLRSGLERTFDDLLFDADAAVLERNSRDVAVRMRTVNRNAEFLAEHLAAHPRVARVHYPKFHGAETYRRHLRPGGGYGGLLSLDLHDAADCAPRFFDALRVCKGPNLGMSYTLACPYTILAHYGELDFAEACGVSRWLIRVAVGTEDANDLTSRFDEALAVASRQRQQG